MGLETDTVDEIIKSDAVGGFLEGFADIVTDTVIDDSAEDFSIEYIKELVDDHIDEITVVLIEIIISGLIYLLRAKKYGSFIRYCWCFNYSLCFAKEKSTKQIGVIQRR